MTRLHLLHTCHGQPHRAALDYTVAPIGGNQVRLTATRCDGTALEAIGRTLPGGGLMVYASTPDDERHMLDHGTEYVGSVYGWSPLIDLPDQRCDECGGEHPGQPCAQPDLFGGES